MDREIKFRGFEPVEKKWIFSPGFLLFPDGKITLKIGENEEGNLITSPINPETLGQFTGLKDSDGIDIYEGDIIHQLSNPDWHSKVDNKYLIEFGYQDLGHASYQQTVGWNATDVRYIGEYYTKSKGILDLCITHPGIRAKVIGNIHENPELL